MFDGGLGEFNPIKGCGVTSSFPDGEAGVVCVGGTGLEALGSPLTPGFGVSSPPLLGGGSTGSGSAGSLGGGVANLAFSSYSHLTHVGHKKDLEAHFSEDIVDLHFKGFISWAVTLQYTKTLVVRYSFRT